jgi:hypothetical protein
VGAQLLSREWKEMEAALPVLEEAREKLGEAAGRVRDRERMPRGAGGDLGKAASGAAGDRRRMLDLRRASRRSLKKRCASPARSVDARRAATAALLSLPLSNGSISSQFRIPSSTSCS